MKATYIILSLLCILCIRPLHGQQDTVGKIDIKDVTVVKSYRADVPDTDPINLDPVATTSTKQVPSYQYQISIVPYAVADPDPQIRPLALEQEEAKSPYNFYGKLGYGSMKNPFGYLGYQVVGEDLYDLNITAEYDALDNHSKISTQKYQEGKLGIMGTYRVFENTYFHLDLGSMFNQRYNRNLPDPQAHNYLHTHGRLGIKNVEESSIGINYELNLGMHRLDVLKATSETSFLSSVSIDKSLIQALQFSLDGEVYAATDDGNLGKAKNSYFSIRPGLKWQNDRLVVHAAYDHTRSDTINHPFVDAYASYAILGDLIQLYVDVDQKTKVNNHYHQYIENRYYSIDSLHASQNTVVKNYFAGLRSNINNQVTVDARVGWKQFRNLGYFDIKSTGTYVQKYVKDLGGIALEAGAQYRPTQDISLGIHADIIRFTSTDRTLYNYPTSSIGIDAEARFLDDKLVLKADSKLSNAIRYQENDSVKKGKTQVELNMEAHYHVHKHVGLWLRVNNLLNNPYERYQGNPRAGIHIVGGVVGRF